MNRRQDEQGVVDEVAWDMAHDRLRQIRTREVLKIGRLTHHHPRLDANEDDYGLDDFFKPEVVGVVDGANAVSSLLTNGKHAPAIDLDVRCHFVPSSTPGHAHLYIDHEVTWGDYLRLLKLLVEMGIVERGFYASARRRGTTLLRLPHVAKGEAPS